MALAPVGSEPHRPPPRLSERLHRLGAELAAPHLVEAAVHRLRRGPEAEQSIIAAITRPGEIDVSPSMWQASDAFRTADHLRYAPQQVLLSGILLAATGLPPVVVEALTPLTEINDTLGDNPLMTPRPIALAVLDLLDTGW